MRSVRLIERRGLRGCSADSVDERFSVIGSCTCDGAIHYRYSIAYKTAWTLSYQKAATQQAAYARTIYDGPTSLYGGAHGRRALWVIWGSAAI